MCHQSRRQGADVDRFDRSSCAADISLAKTVVNRQLSDNEISGLNSMLSNRHRTPLIRWLMLGRDVHARSVDVPLLP